MGVHEDEGLCLFEARDVENEGVIGRSAFGLVDVPDCFGVEGISSETVDCLRREGDESARTYHLAGAGKYPCVRVIRVYPANYRHGMSL